MQWAQTRTSCWSRGPPGLIVTSRLCHTGKRILGDERHVSVFLQSCATAVQEIKIYIFFINSSSTCILGFWHTFRNHFQKWARNPITTLQSENCLRQDSKPTPPWLETTSNNHNQSQSPQTSSAHWRPDVDYSKIKTTANNKIYSKVRHLYKFSEKNKYISAHT